MGDENFESDNIEDADFGAVVSVDPDDADNLGAIEEDALTDDEAEASKLDDEA